MAFKPLYAYKPQNAIQLAGTNSQFALDEGGETWQPLTGLQSISEVGSTATAIDQTVIDDTVKRFLGGIKEAPDYELEFLFYPEDMDQKALREAAAALKVIKIRHQYPSGQICTYECALLGWTMTEGTAEDLNKFKISGKITSELAWTTADPAGDV